MEPDGDRRESRGEKEEGRGTEDVAPRDRSPPPQRDAELDEREHDHRGLGEEREEVEEEGDDAVSTTTAVVEPGPGEQGPEEEDRREHVLALRDPGHRLHRHRVEREEEPGDGRPRDAERPEKPPEEQGGDDVEDDVDGVKGSGRQSERADLQPEGRPRERPVVVGVRAEPDPRERTPEQQRLHDQGMVVPDEPRAKDRMVGDEGRRGDDQGYRPVPEPFRPDHDRNLAYTWMGT